MMPLFDPMDVPESVVSRTRVTEINQIIDALRRRRIGRVEIAEQQSGFRVSNMIRAYCQSQLWRCLDLIDSAELLRRSDHSLGALMLVRGVYETVAAFVHFERRLINTMQPLEGRADLDRVHDFIHGRSFATRIERLINEVGENEAVRATNTLTQIDDLSRIYSEARRDYDHLCEYAHPNALGGFLWYGQHDAKEDCVTFSSSVYESEDIFRWVIIGASLLGVFMQSLLRIEENLPALSGFGAEYLDR